MTDVTKSSRGLDAVSGSASILALVMAAAILAGCSPSATPTLSATPTRSVPLATPSPTVETPPSPAQATGEPTVFAVDSLVVTISDRLRVRSKPRVSADSIKFEPVLPLGTELMVLAGPVLGSGYTWYKVHPISFVGLDSPGSGWVAVAGTDGEPWLASAPDGAVGSSAGARVTMSKRGRFTAPYLGGIRSFAGGYVALGTLDDKLDTVATWYSSNGRDWRRTILSKPIVPCPGWTRRSDLEDVSNATAVGDSVVILATLLAPTAEDCSAQRVVALVSKDGRRWTRSEPFGATAVRYQSAGQPWQIKGGVEVAVGGDVSRWSIWRSTDGLTWGEVASGPRTDDSYLEVLGSDASGRRLATLSFDDQRTELLVSDDESTMRTVRTLPEHYGVVDVVPPRSAGDAWWVAISTWEPGGKVRLLRSTDLVTWDHGRFPRSSMGSLLSGSSGWLAIGSDAPTGDTCGPSVPSYPNLYTSSDGMEWHVRRTRIREDRLPDFVDGPAGILAYEQRNETVIVRHVEVRLDDGLIGPTSPRARLMRPMPDVGLMACGEDEPRG